MGWMVPNRRIDEAQRDVLKQCESTQGQPMWIDGFAGSGKTVLLVYAAQNYAQKNPEKKLCIVVFTHALMHLIQTSIATEYKHKIPVMTYLNFVNKDKNYYDLVLIDEVQDVPVPILRAIRQRTKNIIVAGDDAQSIYESGSRAVHIEQVLEPERLKLPTVYRLTRKIINVVKNILPDSHIVNATSGRMEEIQVTLAHANSQESELSWVWEQAKSFSETGKPSVIVLHNHERIRRFLHFVAKKEGVELPPFRDQNFETTNYTPANNKFAKDSKGECLQYLGNSYGSLTLSDTRPVVYLMTYHSIKGLDFRTVFLPMLTSDTVFWEGDTDIERRLFFVGATRSYLNLFLSYHGDVPHAYVQELPQEELYKIEIGNEESSSDDPAFIF